MALSQNDLDLRRGKKVNSVAVEQFSERYFHKKLTTHVLVYIFKYLVGGMTMGTGHKEVNEASSQNIQLAKQQPQVQKPRLQEAECETGEARNVTLVNDCQLKSNLKHSS